MVDTSRKVAVLRCGENELKHNLQVLYTHQIEIIMNMPCLVGKGEYFYITMYEQNEENRALFKGKFL